MRYSWSSGLNVDGLVMLLWSILMLEIACCIASLSVGCSSVRERREVVVLSDKGLCLVFGSCAASEGVLDGEVSF